MSAQFEHIVRWQCPACGITGETQLDTERDMMAHLILRVERDHKRLSPDCGCNVGNIRCLGDAARAVAGA